MGIRSDHGKRSFGDVARALVELTDCVLFDQIREGPRLSPRNCSVATAATLIAPGRGEQLPFHVRRARDNGLSHDELAVLTAHLAFYTGWPTAASAVPRLRELKDQEARS